MSTVGGSCCEAACVGCYIREFAWKAVCVCCTCVGETVRDGVSLTVFFPVGESCELV